MRYDTESLVSEARDFQCYVETYFHQLRTAYRPTAVSSRCGGNKHLEVKCNRFTHDKFDKTCQSEVSSSSLRRTGRNTFYEGLPFHVV
jgi:hypothetical protein